MLAARGKPYSATSTFATIAAIWYLYSVARLSFFLAPGKVGLTAMVVILQFIPIIGILVAADMWRKSLSLPAIDSVD